MDKFLSLLVAFLVGFLSCTSLVFVSFYRVELPFGISNKSSEAPSDWIKKEGIEVFEDRVVIYIDNPSLSSYAPTGSMRPVLDYNSNGIRIQPKNEDDINVGDIISYESVKGLIVHRVSEKGMDEEGVYFVAKGDNNVYLDGKIRFDDIRYVTVGVIW